MTRTSQGREKRDPSGTWWGGPSLLSLTPGWKSWDPALEVSSTQLHGSAPLSMLDSSSGGKLGSCRGERVLGSYSITGKRVGVGFLCLFLSAWPEFLSHSQRWHIWRFLVRKGPLARLLERKYPELRSLYLGNEGGGQTTSGSPLGSLGENRGTPGLLPGEETT